MAAGPGTPSVGLSSKYVAMPLVLLFEKASVEEAAACDVLQNGHAHLNTSDGDDYSWECVMSSKSAWYQWRVS